MSQSQPYVYRPLDKSRREIRLITVLNIGEIFFVTETTGSDPELYGNPNRVRAIEDKYSSTVRDQSGLLGGPTIVCGASYTWGDASNKRRIIMKQNMWPRGSGLLLMIAIWSWLRSLIFPRYKHETLVDIRASDGCGGLSTGGLLPTSCRYLPFPHW